MTLSVWGTSTFLLLIYETRCSEASFLVKRGPLCRSSEYLCSSQFYREGRTFIRGIRSRLALKKCNWKTLPWLRGRNWWSSSDCISQCTVFSLTTFCSRTMDSYPDCWVALNSVFMQGHGLKQTDADKLNLKTVECFAEIFFGRNAIGIWTNSRKKRFKWTSFQSWWEIF